MAENKNNKGISALFEPTPVPQNNSQSEEQAQLPRVKKGIITRPDAVAAQRSFHVKAPFIGIYRTVRFGLDKISETPVPADVLAELQAQFGEENIELVEVELDVPEAETEAEESK